MPYMEKQIISGDLLEVERYFLLPNGKRAEGRNINPSSEHQEQMNEIQANRRLVRLLNANFSRKQYDVCITLTYSNPPEDEATAKKDINKFTRKVRAYRKENGLPELKYIVTTEKQGQWHHHIIMNDIPFRVVVDIWGRGRVSMSTLENQYQFEDLANYLLAQDKKAKIIEGKQGDRDKEPRRKFARRWSCSKNLKQPEVSKPKKISRRTVERDPKSPKGYRLLSGWKKGCSNMFGYLYQYYRCVKLEEPVHKTNTNRRNKNVL